MADTELRTGDTRDWHISDKPFGPVAAAFLASGIGAVVLGILTTLAEASEGIKSALEWSKSVGPLMGKTIIAVIAFAVSWVILHVAFRDKDFAVLQVLILAAAATYVLVNLLVDISYAIIDPRVRTR